MSIYLKIYHATEGNKTLARQFISSLKKRDKTIAAWWNTDGKTIIKKMQADITAQLQMMPSDYWRLTNLKAINRAVSQVIAGAGSQFQKALYDGQKATMDMAVDELEKQFKSAGLGTVSRAFMADDVMAGINPLTQVITEHFKEDIAKRINSEIAFSLTNGEGAFAASGRLQNAIGISTASADRIAVTEMNRAYSYAQQIRGEEMAAENGSLRKIWVSSHSPDAREDHLQVEQESMENPLEIDADFEVPGKNGIELAQFPHDARLSAGSSVNCKCGIVYVNVEDAEAMAKVITENLESAQS